MLGKILLLVLALWLILNLLRQYRRSLDQPAQSQPESQDMVRCAVCKVHLPKDECIRKNGAYYCCTEHSHRTES
ncbi:hypothetical protein GALL_318230 [mine drainage metagenome]|uniref:Uncharacterized protein n=1 Tax=mine drainage metagenome TaxID=410659 RepID=A0A1J5R2N6_9ZZZZ